MKQEKNYYTNKARRNRKSEEEAEKSAIKCKESVLLNLSRFHMVIGF